jgi:5'-nucleotidase
MLRRISAAGGAALLAATMGVGGAQPASAKPEPMPVRLLAINDFHGNLQPPSSKIVNENGVSVDAGGAAYLAKHIKLHSDENTEIVAAGDLIGASPLISAAYHDEPAVEVLGAMGLKVSAVGNHEFDEGIDELRRIQNGGCHPVDGCSPAGPWPGARFSYLGANVLKEGTTETALPPVSIRKINGVRVGFIGLVTKTTPTIVTASGIAGLEFADEVAAGNRAAAYLREQGVRAIVALVHEGDSVRAGQSPDSCPTTTTAGTTIAKNLSPAVDVVVMGHSHQAYICQTTDPAGQPRIYTQGSSLGRVLTQIDFLVDRRTKDVIRSSVVADNHVVTREGKPDEAIEKLVATWAERTAPVANRPVGSITAEMSNRSALASGEIPLGDLIADSQLAAAQAGGAVVAFMNPGGIREPLTYRQSGVEGDGVVTYGEAFTVQPFNNLVQVRTLTGAQLDALLEQQFTTGSGKILQPSASLTYTMSLSQPVGSRISDIRINGVPVDPAAGYRVAANNFLMGGGDGFSVFTQGADDLWSGPLDIDAFVAYLGANSPITPPAANRITLVP